MGARRDGALAALALGAFSAGVFVTETTPSPPFLALGAAAALAVEAAALERDRRRTAVRRYWERPATQLAALALAVALAGLGAVVAPSSVLSAGIGALAAYLLLLAGVAARRRRP